MDYDAYIDLVINQLQVESLNNYELKIIEGCFDRNWEVEIAVNLIQTSWEEEQGGENNTFEKYD